MWSLDLSSAVLGNSIALVRKVDKISLYRFFPKAGMPTLVPSLSDKEVKEVNTSVKSLQKKVTSRSPSKPIRYNDYTPEERASIGKYAAENGIASAVRHFSRVGSKKVPKSTARRLKNEYLRKMKELVRSYIHSSPSYSRSLITATVANYMFMSQCNLTFLEHKIAKKKRHKQV